MPLIEGDPCLGSIIQRIIWTAVECTKWKSLKLIHHYKIIVKMSKFFCIMHEKLVGLFPKSVCIKFCMLSGVVGWLHCTSEFNILFSMFNYLMIPSILTIHSDMSWMNSNLTGRRLFIYLPCHIHEVIFTNYHRCQMPFFWSMDNNPEDEFLLLLWASNTQSYHD